MEIGKEEVVPGHSHIFIDTAAQVVMIHIEATPGQDIGIITTTPGVAHDVQVPHTGITAIDLTMTHHIDHTADHPDQEVPHPITPEIEADHIHEIPQDDICIGHTHTRADHKANHITRGTPQ